MTDPTSLARHNRRAEAFAGIVRLEHPPLDLLAGPSWRLLVQVAARQWSVDPALILGPSRDQLVAAARHHAMWLVRQHCRRSFPAIGRLFGRDHSTVVSGIRHHLERMAGTRRKPFVWSRSALRSFTRLMRDGLSMKAAAKVLGLCCTDYLRCPDRRRLKREAISQFRQREFNRRQRLEAA